MTRRKTNDTGSVRADEVADLTSAPTGRSRPALSMWLFGAILLTTTLAVMSAAHWIDRLVQAQARIEAERYLKASAKTLSNALDREMDQHIHEVRILASLPQVKRHEDAAALRAVLDNFSQSFPDYAWVGVASPDGHVIGGAGGLLNGVDVSARPWFAGAHERGFVGDVHPAKLLAQLLPEKTEPYRFVDIALPLNDDEGRLVGVLGTHLSWHWADSVRHEFLEQLLSDRGAEAMVVSANGDVLLGPQGSQGAHLAVVPHDYLSASVTSVGHGEFRGMGWRVEVRQPEALAMAPYRRLHSQTLAAGWIVCLIATPFLWGLSRRLAAPLQELSLALANGTPGGSPQGWAVSHEIQVLHQALLTYDLLQRKQSDELARQASTLECRVKERTQALANSERTLADVLSNLPAMVAHFDCEERCLFANELALKVHDLTREQALGQPLRTGVSAQAYELHKPHIAAALNGQRARFEGTEQRNGHAMHYQVHLVPDRDNSGDVQGFYLMTFDVTALKEAQERLERSEARLRAIADNLPVMISYIDADHRLGFANRTFEHWTGISIRDAVGRPLREVIGDALYGQRRRALRRALQGERVEFEVESEAMGLRRSLQTIYVPDMQTVNRARGVYTLTMDVTELRSAERRMAELALTDSLTGLANRRRLEEHLPQALARARRHAKAMALCLLDIDHFKRINDTHGHSVGDRVLVEFAARLSSAVRKSDFVARLAGDEFVVLLEDLSHVHEAELVAQKLTQCIRSPFSTSAGSLNVTTSVGVAFLASNALCAPHDLMALADEALYQTKNCGRDGYSRSMAA